MDAYILETLVSAGWRRSGATYWTLGEARNEGERLIRRKLARRVRILPVEVHSEAVVELPAVTGAGRP
jgi:hypothetical protein